MAAGLANGLQGPLEGDEAGTYGLLFIALVAFDMYAHTFCVEENGHTRHWALLLGVFVLMLLMAAATVMINWWKRTEPRRLDYRALAEALRVRVAWGLAGIGRSVADSYLSQLRSEMSWTRTALLHISPPPHFWSEEFDALPAAEQRARLATIGELWVSEQAAHFAKAHKREHDNARKFRRMGFGLALLAVAIAVSLFFIPYPHWHWPWCMPGHGHDQAEAVSSVAHPAHWTILLAGVTALVAGFAVAYSERRAFESLASQYDRMQTVFDFAKVEIDRHLENGNVPAAQAVLEEIGHEAIAEHAQWLIARRARPFELHIGG
jgi:hypothetical protein